MSLYAHGYQVIERPPIEWARAFRWTRRIAWGRLAAVALNVGLWVLISRGVAALIR